MAEETSKTRKKGSVAKKAATTKSVKKAAPAKKSAAPKKKAAAPRVKKPQAVAVAPSPTVSASAAPVDADTRQQMIAEAAYLRAEQRGFVGGDPVEDWLAAEAEIDAMLAARAAAGQ